MQESVNQRSFYVEEQNPNHNANTLQPLFRRLWVLILGLILGGAIGALVSQQTTPIYESSVYVLVTPTSGNVGTSPDVNQLANNYAHAFSTLVLEPTVVGKNVIASGVGVDPWDIKSVTNVEVSPNAPMLHITTRSPDSNNASTLANTLGSALVSYTDQMADQTGYRAALVSKAAPPQDPILPDRRSNIALGAVAGLLVGGTLAILWKNPLRRASKKIERKGSHDG